jgi:hypothetical protein
LAEFFSRQVGKKKAAKLEAKAEKRDMREAMEEERQKRKEREEQRELERVEAEAQRKKEREQKEEEERRIAEEIKKKEEEDFDKWKDMFETGDDGAQADDDLQESQGMLQEFIDYLKDNKITPLEEVAAKFNLKSQEALNRIEGLEAMGRITGLMDDRGKFIYISIEEMQGVAKWINLQGRVGVEDLVSESARLVDMTPRAKEVIVDDTILEEEGAT